MGFCEDYVHSVWIESLAEHHYWFEAILSLDRLWMRKRNSPVTRPFGRIPPGKFQRDASAWTKVCSGPNKASMNQFTYVDFGRLFIVAAPFPRSGYHEQEDQSRPSRSR